MSDPHTDEGSSTAAVPSTPLVRMRPRGMILEFERADRFPSTSALRRDLQRAGVPGDLVDSAFVRALDRATRVLHDRLEDDADGSWLRRIEEDSVGAYRSIDATVADRLGEIARYTRADSLGPPDLGKVPDRRRPPRFGHRELRSTATHAGTSAAYAALAAWATAGPDNLEHLGRDPAGALTSALPDLPGPVRRRLLDRLERAGARTDTASRRS